MSEKMILVVVPEGTKVRYLVSQYVNAPLVVNMDDFQTAEYSLGSSRPSFGLPVFDAERFEPEMVHEHDFALWKVGRTGLACSCGLVRIGHLIFTSREEADQYAEGPGCEPNRPRAWVDSDDSPPAPISTCQSDGDGDCTHRSCPQLRDGEPKATGRSCPLYEWGDSERAGG